MSVPISELSIPISILSSLVAMPIPSSDVADVHSRLTMMVTLFFLAIPSVLSMSMSTAITCAICVSISTVLSISTVMSTVLSTAICVSISSVLSISLVDLDCHVDLDCDVDRLVDLDCHVDLDCLHLCRVNDVHALVGLDNHSMSEIRIGGSADTHYPPPRLIARSL